MSAMVRINSKNVSDVKKLKGIAAFAAFLIVFLFVYLALKLYALPSVILRFLGVSALLMLVSFFACYKFVSGKFITAVTVFTLSMFAFSLGQNILYGFGINYEYYFLNDYYAGIFEKNVELLISSVEYSIACMAFFCIAALTSVRTASYEKRKSLELPSIKNDVAKNVFIVLFILSAIPELAYKVYTARYALLYGYVSTLELVKPAIVRYLGVFFLPATIGVFVCAKNDLPFMLVALGCAIINCLLDFIVGGRSMAVGLVVGLFMAFVLDKKIPAKSLLLIFLFGFLLMALSLSVRDYRVDNSRGFFALFIDNIFSKNVILSFFGEAGFNGSSSVWTMQLVKTGKIEHFYGLTYVGSVFGLIPSSVDFLGVAAAFSRYTQLESLLTEAYSFDFGVGFSLVAESYLNFGYFGFIAIFFEGLLLCKLLNIDDYSDTGWKNYVPIVLLSVLLTMPRRDTVFFSNQFTSCVIVPYVVMLIVTWVKENIKVE